MKAIFRQAKANLRSRKLQTGLIFLTLAASAMLLATALAAYFSGYGVYDRLMERTNGAHIWLKLKSDGGSTAELLRVLKANPEVTAMTPPMPTFQVTLEANHHETTVEVRDWFPENRVAQPIVASGRLPKAHTHEILVDHNLARTFGVRPGDKVRLLFAQGDTTFTVVGTFVSSAFCAFPDCKPPSVYLGPGTLAASLQKQHATPPEWTIGVRIRHPQRAKAVYRQLQQALPQGALTGYTWLSVRKIVGFSFRIQSIFMLVFAALAALVSGFLIANAIGGAIRAQTRQIGLLRAVGFTNGQLAAVYLGEYEAIGLVGGIVGIAASVPLSARIFRELNERYGMGNAAPPAWALAAVLGFVLLLIVVAAAFPLRRIARLDTVTAIRMGAEPPRRKGVHLPRLPLSLSYGLSSVLSTPVRSSLTTLGLVMVALAISVSLSLYATVQMFVHDPVGMGMVPNADVSLTITVPKFPAQKIQEALAADRRVERFACEVWAPVRIQGESEDIYPRFVCGDLSVYENMLLEGRMLRGNGEAVAGYTLAREHGWKPGDEVTLLVRGKPHTLRIVGIYRENNNLGKMFILPLSLLGKAPVTFYADLKPGVDPHGFLQEMQQRFGDAVRGKVLAERYTASNGPDVGKMLTATVVALSLLLSLIAAFGVLSSLSMNVHEDRRTVGILKAVGMTPGQVAASVVTAAVLMAVVGYAVGAPVGIVVARWLFNALGEMVGLGPIRVPVHLLGEVLLLPGMAAVAALGAYLPARRAARLPVAQVLREE